jgi:Protein of unknown function (DUF3025)
LPAPPRAEGTALAHLAQALTGIDWSPPWLRPWSSVLQPLARTVLSGHTVAQALNQLSRGFDAPVSFVPQADLPVGVAYEDHIARTRQVPTRDNLHDLFNGACWLRFGRTKSRLNQLQAQQIASQGVLATRGPLRDALTLFDENVLLLAAPMPLRQALVQRDWQALFVQQRAVWASAHAAVFGHALLEKLMQPYKSITAHVWLLPEQAPTSDAELDAQLAASLSEQALVPKPFVPLPVLGIPGWSPLNAQPDFYDDPQVFRPKPV